MNKERILSHVAEALDYFEDCRAVVFADGVIVIDTAQGGGMIIQLQELKTTEFYTPPRPMTDDDIPF